MVKLRKAKLIITLFTVLLLCGCTEGQYGSLPWESSASNTRAPVVTPNQTSIDSRAPIPSAPTEFSSLPAVNVAILLPLSGPQAQVGEALLQSAQLALFDIGYTNFNLMPRDTGGNAAGATQAALSAINDGAQIIIGPLFADCVSAVKSIAKPRNINVIAFSTDWALADNSTYLMGFMPFSQVDRITKYATQHGYKDFAIVSAKYKYGDLVTSRFEQRLRDNGGKVSKSLRYTLGDSSIVDQVATLNDGENGNFQAIFMPVGGEETETISSALSKHGMSPERVKRMGTGLWDDPRIASQPNMQGAWFAAPSPKSRQDFEMKYLNTYGQKPPRLATLSYDATALVATLAKNGLEKNGQPDFNSVAITNRNGFNGTDGVFRFGQNGVIERSLAVLEFRDGQIIEIDPASSRF